MKNLENYGVQELGTKEVKEIDGGKNLIEYLAEGIGWSVGEIVNGVEWIGENNLDATYVPGHYMP